MIGILGSRILVSPEARARSSALRFAFAAFLRSFLDFAGGGKGCQSRGLGRKMRKVLRDGGETVMVELIICIGNDELERGELTEFITSSVSLGGLLLLV